MGGLKPGRAVAGAALDVYAREPLPEDSPLRDAPNLVLTPHVAGFSDAAIAHVTDVVAHNIRSLANQAPLLNAVNGA